MSMSAAETRLLLAMARYLSNDGEHAPSIFDVEDALKAVEATGENAKENGGAPPSKTGAGGGDPLPQPVPHEVYERLMVRAEQRALALARLSLVHQQLRKEGAKIEHRLRHAGQLFCANWLRDALAASTTETPTP